MKLCIPHRGKKNVSFKETKSPYALSLFSYVSEKLLKFSNCQNFEYLSWKPYLKGIVQAL